MVPSQRSIRSVRRAAGLERARRIAARSFVVLALAFEPAALGAATRQDARPSDTEFEQLVGVLDSTAPAEQKQAAVANVYRLAAAALVDGNEELVDLAREALEGQVGTPSAREVVLVLDLLRTPDAEPGVSDQVWVTRHLDAAKSFSWTGQYLPADELLDAIGARAAITEGLLRVELHLVRADVQSHLGRPGRAAAALDVVDRALERWDLGEFHVAAMIQLATMRYRLGQYPATRALLRDTVQRAEEASAEAELLDCWNLLGILSEREGDLAAAIAYYDRVLDRTRTGDIAARTLVNRGRALRESGELTRAKEDFMEALELARGKVLLVEAGAHDGLGRVAIAEGRLDDASHLLDRAIRIERDQGLVDYLGHTLQGKALLEVARGDIERAREAMTDAEEFLEMGGSESLTPRAVAELRSRYSRWSEIAQEIAVLDVARADTEERGREARLAGLWQAGRWSARALLAGMSQRSGFGLELEPEELLDSMAALLGERRALVRFVETADALFAYVVHGGSIRLIELGEKEPIFAAAHAFVVDVCETAAVRDPGGVSRLGFEVYRRTLGPALELLPSDLEEIVVIPTERLAAIPFEATVRSAPAASFEEIAYVAKDLDISYAPSLPCLAHLSVRGADHGRGRGLFLGDIVVPLEHEGLPRGHRLEEELSYLQPLPASRREAIHLALKSVDPKDREALYESYGRLLDSRERDERWSTPSFDVFLGGLASAQALAEPRSYRRVHIAAHSFVDADEPSYRGILLSPGPDDDGLLDLARIRDLELDADLVVLSGCGTARGRTLGAEGVQSIAAAFLEAGGSSVVASLWLVDDALTEELMTVFYDELAKDITVQAALEAAKRSLWKHGPRGLRTGKLENEYVELSSYHPSFWAAFVYFGSPR